MITCISHFYLPVRDIDETIAFYTRHLGFSLLRKYTVNGELAAYLGLGGVLLELSVSANTPSVDKRKELRLGLVVVDLDATLARLKADGVEVAREPWSAATFWGRQCQILDPSGYRVSLRQYRAPDGPDYPDWRPETENVVRLA